MTVVIFDVDDTLYQQIDPFRLAIEDVFLPEYKQIRRELQRAKRKMDMQPQMIAYRQSETALQGILDEICLEMSTVISDDIKVDAGNCHV